MTEPGPPISTPVTKPAHYTSGSRECIDIIRDHLNADQFEGYCIGNAIKYRHRAGLKWNEAEDLAKADWYWRMAAGDDPRLDGQGQE